MPAAIGWKWTLCKYSVKGYHSKLYVIIEVLLINGNVRCVTCFFVFVAQDKPKSVKQKTTSIQSLAHLLREFCSNTWHTSANFFLRDFFVGLLLANDIAISAVLLLLLSSPTILFLPRFLLLRSTTSPPPQESNFLLDRRTASSLHLVTLINSLTFQITTVSPKYWIFASLNAPLATLELRFLVAMRVIASVPARMDWVLRSVSRASRWGSQVGLVQHWMQADWRQSV